MASEKQKERQEQQEQKESPTQDHTDNAQPKDEVTTKGREIKDNLDQLLDEIDEILEEDSEEFVENYIQRGGE